MGRVPFCIGGPAETWCRQIKKRGQKTKIRNISRGEMEGYMREKEVDKRENFPPQKQRKPKLNKTTERQSITINRKTDEKHIPQPLYYK